MKNLKQMMLILISVMFLLMSSNVIHACQPPCAPEPNPVITFFENLRITKKLKRLSEKPYRPDFIQTLGTRGTPTINVNYTFDGCLWSYEYSILSNLAPPDEIFDFRIFTSAEVSNISAPLGWDSNVYNNYIHWFSTDPSYDVSHGGTLSGFSFKSAIGPGTVTWGLLDWNPTSGPPIYTGMKSMGDVTGPFGPYVPVPIFRMADYQWGDPIPGYIFYGSFFEGWMYALIENIGNADAFNVIATVSACPENAEIIDGEVTIGDVPVGNLVWSSDTFTIQTDLFEPGDPEEVIFWRIEYDDINGVHHVKEDIPQ